MAGRRNITAEEAIKAAKNSNGIVAAIARNLGVSRQTVYVLRKKYPTFAQAIEDEREKLKDMAESIMYQKIMQGDNTMIIFYLKTQAPERGYVEKQKLEHSGEVALGWAEFVREARGEE